LHPIDAADGLGIGVGADLQNLVMIDEHFATWSIGGIAQPFLGLAIGISVRRF
jgi:hypothetical protein